MTNWQTYLKSVSETYKNWWESYTITDVEGRVKANNRPSLLLDLQVETVAKKEGSEREEKTERLEILAGARKYSLDARDHVLLQGKPGSGKSTALERLLLESASQSDGTVIPVLVELRSYKTSVIDLMRDFLKRHKLWLEKEQIELLLFQKQFFLLIDGINELPSDEAANEVIRFRRNNLNVPMVFTTRELGLRGNLGIDKQLTLQPLSETQMKAFVRGYLGNDELLKQLRNERLQKLGETPLLLWMLCSIYSACGRIPDNLGETFREFTRNYDEKLKADVTTQSDSKRLWADSLQYLSFEMTTRKDEPVIGVGEAKKLIGEFLNTNRENDSLNRQCLWLEDLVHHHLIQKRDEDNIEFHHQLIQEYYAAESLISKLDSLTDRDLQWRYLNYLKWTEPIALMLGLLKDREQALRVVRLALAMDFGLGARLAGEVNPSWQEETVKLVLELDVPKIIKIILLEKTRSDVAVRNLVENLTDSNEYVRKHATSALHQLATENSIALLGKLLEHPENHARSHALTVLSKIDSESIIPHLQKASQDSDQLIRRYATYCLEEKGISIERKQDKLEDCLEQEKGISIERKQDKSEEQFPYILNLNIICPDYDTYVEEIKSTSDIEKLVEALEYPNLLVRHQAIVSISSTEIDSYLALMKLKQVIKNENILMKDTFPLDTLTDLINVIELLQKKLGYYTLEPMYLPSDSLILNAKITKYLLKLDKSKFLARIGFTLNNPEPLKSALYQLIQTTPAIEDITNEYGTFYRVEGELIGINQVSLSVITLWLKRNIDNQFQFITLKPKKEK